VRCVYAALARAHLRRARSRRKCYFAKPQAYPLQSSVQLRCSVVIPTYNRLNVLPRAVASVLAQDEPDFELIIVDDSTDDTPQWLATQTIRASRSFGRSGNPA
jgi:cellulose synthase/poly-beta-1,6-N-acetylglucosamine synthase-like glycosyltransferase